MVVAPPLSSASERENSSPNNPLALPSEKKGHRSQEKELENRENDEAGSLGKSRKGFVSPFAVGGDQKGGQNKSLHDEGKREGDISVPKKERPAKNRSCHSPSGNSHSRSYPER